MLSKPLLMPLLGASLATGPATPLRTPVLAAQACGWVGDLALLATWTVGAPLQALSAARRDRTLGLPVAAYSVTLTSMAVAAGRLGPAVSPAARRLAAAGALLLLASDSMLGVRKFVLASPPARLEGAVMATYTAGQLLLSEAASRA